VVAESGATAEDERVARLEQHRVDRIAAPQPSKQKPRRVAERHRHHRDARPDRLRALVLVLVETHPAVGVIVINDAQVGRERHPDRGGDFPGEIG